MDTVVTPRPEIATSWRRSRLYGLRPDVVPPPERTSVGDSSQLAEVASPVLERARVDLDNATAALLLADADYRVVDICCTQPRLDDAIAQVGVSVGMRLGEEDIGTNSVGTAGELRRGVAVRGDEHYAHLFNDFDCYGAPVVHPLTRRLVGVLDLSSRQGDDHPLYSVLVRQVVREIEERLLERSPASSRVLAHAFDTRARHRGRAAVALGPRMVLATRAALDMLNPADHETLRELTELSRTRPSEHPSIQLSSGRHVRVRIEPVEGTEGFLIDLLTHGEPHRSRVDTTAQRWPLLVVGEPGTGRTSSARARFGAATPVAADAAEVVTTGEASWAERVCWMLDRNGTGLLLENVQLLSEHALTLLAKKADNAKRAVVFTCTPGEHLSGSHAVLNTVCAERIELVPLRLRRHEIPALANWMMTDRPEVAPRLTPAVLRMLSGQSWPGNLAELRRVVDALAARRLCGDIVVADLPPHYRTGRAVNTPVEQAEVDTIRSVLDSVGGNKKRAAGALGVSRSTLYNRIRALGIEI